MNLEKRFSIAHYDRFHNAYDSMFYNIMKNADQSYINNIHDVYFGKYFVYEYNGQKRRAGNPMGVEASDAQIDYLFKLQEETGIEISLTFNTVEIPHELAFDPGLTREFVEWIGSYYDRGMRSCTISSEHIMRMGWLQERCPEMRWKSTVNQIVADAQQFVDYAYLGYNTILLDRSLNRNIKELKRIRKAQNHLNSFKPEKKLLTSLLVAEACIYHCPFKKEHDSVGEVISTEYFNGPAELSCNAWRNFPIFGDLPRSGINIVANDADTFASFGNLVDIFKYSGRLTKPILQPNESQYMKGAWFYNPSKNKFSQSTTYADETVYADNFKDIMDNNLGPIHNWTPGWIDTRYTKEDWRTTYKPYDGIWSTDKGKRLEKILTNCRNQCWDCHECERTFGMNDIDSALQIKKQWQ
jgi:hypothetical protein